MHIKLILIIAATITIEDMIHGNSVCDRKGGGGMVRL